MNYSHFLVQFVIVRMQSVAKKRNIEGLVDEDAEFRTNSRLDVGGQREAHLQDPLEAQRQAGLVRRQWTDFQGDQFILVMKCHVINADLKCYNIDQGAYRIIL